jgi:hypothetical protein
MGSNTYPIPSGIIHEPLISKTLTTHLLITSISEEMQNILAQQRAPRNTVLSRMNSVGLHGGKRTVVPQYGQG